jgi:hypothetical protein
MTLLAIIDFALLIGAASCLMALFFVGSSSQFLPIGVLNLRATKRNAAILRPTGA